MPPTTTMASTVLRHLSAVLAWVSSGCVAAIVLLVTADVLSRAATDRSIAGAFEANEALLVAGVLLSFAHTLERGEHVRIDAVADRLPERARRWVDLLADVAVLAIAVVFLIATADGAMQSIRLGEFKTGLVRFPVWPAKLAVAVGFGCLSLAALLRLAISRKGASSASAPISTGAEARV